MFGKIIRDQKGAAMPLALMVMLVLGLLGTALWQYSTTDTLHVKLDEQRKQAYYLARSGADSALRAWMEAPSSNKPNGTTEPVNYGAGNFKVTISAQTKITDPLVIESTGKVGDMEQKVKVTITSNFIFGHELDWYDESSGHIPEKGKTPKDGSGKHVVLKVGNKLKDNKKTVALKSDAMYFENSLGDPFQERLELHAVTIVFASGTVIDMNQQGSNNGRVILFVPDGKGTVIGGNTYGRIYLQDVKVNNSTNTTISKKAWYFLKKPGGVDLTNLQSGDLIPNNDTPNPPSPLSSQQITWS